MNNQRVRGCRSVVGGWRLIPGFPVMLACMTVAAICGCSGDGQTRTDLSGSDVAGTDLAGSDIAGSDHGRDAIQDAGGDAVSPQDNGVIDGFVCTPSSKTCSLNLARACSEDGSVLTETDCGLTDQVCVDGECLNCPPGLGECPSAGVARRCRIDGSGWDEETCGEGLVCADGRCLECDPGRYVCIDSRKLMQCNSEGTGVEPIKDCWTTVPGEVCTAGQCVNLCEVKSATLSNSGCEFYSIDMEQYRDSEPPYYGENAPFALVVSNMFEGIDATVKVYRGETLVKTVTAWAGAATTIPLDPLNISGVGVTDQTYRIESNLPIVAYQFNPLENVGVFSNDASVLFPVGALGKSHRVVSMPATGANGAGQFLTGTVSVIAVEDGVTTVHVTPTVDLLAGSGIPAISAGVSGTFTMNKGQVANLETIPTAGADLSGSLVEADRKIAVFSGHICAYAPYSTCTGGTCSFDPGVTCSETVSCPFIMACDHLEDQVPPVAALGMEYVIPKSAARGAAPDLVRVVADEDGTTVTITPSVADSKVLNAGQVYEFEIDRSVVVSADKRILVSTFLEGQDAPGSAHVTCFNAEATAVCAGASDTGCVCWDAVLGTGGTESCSSDADCSPDDANIGDPSLIVAIPVRQFRDRYVFLAPTKYAYSYISVAAHTTTTVILDGKAMAVAEFQPISGTGYSTAVRAIDQGYHVIESDEPVGLYVYGWDTYVSYGYPAGMLLNDLTGTEVQ